MSNLKFDDKYYLYLDAVREGGKINMFGAAQHLEMHFPELDRKSSKAILMDWMQTFSDRHPRD